jgi:hypothetical protein
MYSGWIGIALAFIDFRLASRSHGQMTRRRHMARMEYWLSYNDEEQSKSLEKKCVKTHYNATLVIFNKCLLFLACFSLCLYFLTRVLRRICAISLLLVTKLNINLLEQTSRSPYYPPVSFLFPFFLFLLVFSRFISIANLFVLVILDMLL